CSSSSTATAYPCDRIARASTGRSAENACSTFPFAVDSNGTRRPIQFVPPTKCRESSCARCSTPRGVGTPRLIVSPERSARARNAGAASSTSPALARALDEPAALESPDEARGGALREAGVGGELPHAERTVRFDDAREQLGGTVDRLGARLGRHS